MFKSSTVYVNRRLTNVTPSQHATERLVIDLQDILIGPTSLHNANRLAQYAAGVAPGNESTEPGKARELAIAMKEAGERYLKATARRTRSTKKAE